MDGDLIENEEEKSIPDKEVLGFDTRFQYTREGLMVYDIHAVISLDKTNAK